MTSLKAFLVTAVATTLSMSALTAQARDFRLGLITPPAHLWTQAAESFAEELNERSEGQHSVSIFPSQQLGNEAQMVQQLQAGSLDMAFLTIAEISNRLPDFGALYAPYLVENVDQAAALLRSDTATGMLDQLPSLAGLVGIGYGMAGMRQVLSRTPIETAQDLRGKKIRITPFDPIRDFYLAADSAPTPLPLPAVYDALANGQVDAIDMDFDSILILKFHEQADNLLISNHMMFPMVGVVSARVWRELSAEDRELVEATMSSHLDGVITAFQQQDAEQEAELRGMGINIVEADDAFFRGVIEAWESVWAAEAPSLAVLRETAARLNSQ
ncbi:TRAP transporter substrate-binding protein [Billgrantia sp. Q4P2]|uniref:TRAP transporter substrate-binding protein n=1 Tax=Billgrantia sp. Q4P2 TaxID=3463857 RepID=UPI00405796F2